MPNPYYSSSEVSGTDVSESYLKDAKSIVGDIRMPRSGRAWLFDGVDDKAQWEIADSGTWYVTYYDVSAGSYTSAIAITHDGTYYVFQPGSSTIIWNLKLWSDNTATSSQIEATSYNSIPSNLKGWYFCEEEDGNIGFDSSGNENHIVFSGITQSTFHAVDKSVVKSYANEVGFTLSDGSTYYENNDGTGLIPSGTIIPRDESNTSKCTAYLSNGTQADLQYSGKAPNPGLYLPSVVTGNGTDVYADLGSALIPETADFEITVWYYHISSTDRHIIISQGNVYLAANQDVQQSDNALEDSLAARLDFGNITINNGLVGSQWHKIVFNRTGDLFTLTVTNEDGSQLSDTVTKSATFITPNSWILNLNGSSLYSPGRIGLVSITAGGVTKYILPRAETRTVDVLGDDGSASTGSIVNGTLSSIYANRGHGEWKDPRVSHGGKVDSGSLIPTKLDDSQYADGTNIDEDSDSHVPANKLGDPTSSIDFTGGNANTPFADQSGAETEYTIGTDRNTASSGKRRKRVVDSYEDRLGTSKEPMTSSQDDDFFGDN